MKRSIIKRSIAAFLAAALLAGCAAQDDGILSSIGNSSVNESSMSDNSDIDDTSSNIDDNSEVTSDSNSVTESDTSSDTSKQEESSASEQKDTSKADNTEKTQESEKPADTTKATTTATTKNNSQNKPAASTSNFTVQWKKSSDWEEGGKKCGGYEVIITNNGTAVNGWTATITVPNNTKLTSHWNGIFSVSGNTMTVKNESYNGTIEKGASVSFGFNYSADSYINEGKVTVNGSSANTNPSNNGGNNNNNNNNNNDQTAVSKPASTVPPAPSDPKGTTPVSQHGQLSVKNGQLVDKNGKGYQLRGMSTHGLTWFPEFVNESAFKTLRDDWNTNVVRLAMYVDEYGNGQCYMGNKSGSLELLEKGVDICIKLDMYVIIDWHVLNPGDPSKYTDEAKSFFETVSKRYAKYPNVIYEICNEPNGGASWSGNIKPYAEKIIPVIRKNAPNSVIIVGTPTWSQEIDKPLSDPLSYKNVMYAFHFYAATHAGLRSNVENCVAQGLPVFVSEFGTCDASGGGANDFNETQKWLSYFDNNGISYCNWSLCNKDETCSVLRPGTSASGNWSESNLTENGKWIHNWLKNH